MFHQSDATTGITDETLICDMIPSRLYLSLLLAILSCGQRDKTAADTLFRPVHSDESGITFSNDLTFDKDFNVYTYRNFYNGGGVGLGDVNNDGLIDIYLTSNMGDNKLYLNKGGLKFEDVTTRAGVAGTKAWSTGVSLADVNGDGWLDIYVCNSGDVKGDNKQNELFINNGDLTFTEKGEEYGIADRGFSTHAVFFDYDKDNDLDLYILNNSYQAIGSFNLRKNERPNRDPLGGDKLMRNDHGRFVDVSEPAGIYGSVIGFGLGVTIGDVNDDGWQDIYVSNDFFERDYLYVNNGDGTFKEDLTNQMKSISGASMGADLADINNDGNPEIFVTEMLPAENERIKTVSNFENWDRYQYAVQNDYYHQFARNMLQLNNGNNTFSEIGRMAGVEATDWSWGALMFDMDNDGLKDVFVANGIYQDLTNQDYLQYVSNEEVVKSIVSGGGVDYKKLVELIPSNPISNFAFHNEGNLRFKNMAREWGLSEPDFSNGSAYGDLDNDGDLDLVVNRVNTPAALYENRTNELKPENKYLRFDLKGLGANVNAFGTKIMAFDGGKKFYLEHMPIRGFQSSMDPRPNLGVGAVDQLDSVVLTWPDGTVTRVQNVKTNQVVSAEQALSAGERPEPSLPALSQFTEIANIVDYEHRESEFIDFDRDRLTFHMISSEGPRTSRADVNGDGKVDFYIGGARGSAGVLFIGDSRRPAFTRASEETFEADKGSEDAGSEFFDADGDGDKDLYVCSGGNEVSSTSATLADRLYFNDGKGKFTKSPQLLPTPKFESKSVVKASDYDNDGDMDLFVGVRLHPGLYGLPGDGYLLQNDGKGTFTNVDAAPLKNIGMITDAAWADIDGDKDDDLLVVGEYMAIRIFTNEGGNIVERVDALPKSNGWWHRLVPADLDRDGDMDFVVGNFGLNSRFHASTTKPVCMYVNDFDLNGTMEQIVCTYVDDKSYPLPLRHDLISQIPSLKKKYLKYENYKDETIQDVFTPEQLAKATILYAYQMSSVVLLNDGSGNFTTKELPVEAQLSPVYAIEVSDFNNDGNPDIVAGGNLYRVKPEVGRYDASYGVLMLGDGKGDFTTSVHPKIKYQFSIDGEIRDLFTIRFQRAGASDNVLFVARNNDTMLTFVSSVSR